ncbi:MAG TPA: dTDP-4-dehydrorhamnose reductase [Candidatus Dormibacteraeota bacterium]|nr:dTDP-4-dehydrorhamnose reductase [Candidatus Dormibacteraeota bacterium]
MSADRALVRLVLGAGGMLGRAVTEALEEAYPGTIAATRAEADVTDGFRLEAEVERLRPDVVINCAAYTDVDGCEIDRDRARRVNAEGAGNVAMAAAATGSRVVQVSTDFVFDGRRGVPYTEDDPPAPLSEYGRSKLDGERRVAAATSEHLIVRTSWLYGLGRSNFVDSIRTRAANGGTLRVVNDQFGSPTYAVDLARALLLLIDRNARGLVHFANAGVCSRYDLAREILAAGGSGTGELKAITTGEAGRIAVRPAYSALDTSLYSRLTGQSPRAWQEALRDYLAAEPRRSGGP